MSRVLPSASRLERLQEAAQRRAELEEAKRQEMEARADQRLEAERRARETRETDKLERDARVMERLGELRERWDRADKKVASVRNQIQKAASERVAAWQRRRQFAMARLHPETLFERMRRQTEEEVAMAGMEKRKAGPGAKKARRRPASSGRVLPRGPPPCLIEPNFIANAIRALYDGQEDDSITMRRLEEAQRAAEEAQRRHFLAVREECVLDFRKMLRVRHLRRTCDAHLHPE